MSTQGKSAAITALKAKNPTWTNARIAKVAKCSAPFVSKVLSTAKAAVPEAPMMRPDNLPPPTPTTPSAWATQVGGAHYTKLKIQPMQYSLDNGLDAAQHTIIKYVTRFRSKGGVVDLQKAIHVIQMLIEREPT